MAAAEAVKVIVRCRPMNAKEESDGRQCIMEMNCKTGQCHLRCMGALRVRCSTMASCGTVCALCVRCAWQCVCAVRCSTMASFVHVRLHACLHSRRMLAGLAGSFPPLLPVQCSTHMYAR